MEDRVGASSSRDNLGSGVTTWKDTRWSWNGMEWNEMLFALTLDDPQKCDGIRPFGAMFLLLLLVAVTCLGVPWERNGAQCYGIGAGNFPIELWLWLDTCASSRPVSRWFFPQTCHIQWN